MSAVPGLVFGLSGPLDADTGEGSVAPGAFDAAPVEPGSGDEPAGRSVGDACEHAVNKATVAIAMHSTRRFVIWALPA